MSKWNRIFKKGGSDSADCLSGGNLYGHRDLFAASGLRSRGGEDGDPLL